MRWVAGGSFLLVAAFAHAGGPLAVCNNVAVKYPGAGTVTLNYDRGALGSRTKAQADALITAAISVWPSVATTTVRLERGADLPVDVTAANYMTYLNSADGLSPVIYDADGSILDLMLGVGAKAHLLGLAGSTYSDTNNNCQYTEGFAVISGYISVPDTTLQVLVAHEIGHLIGLGHTQLNANQNLSSSDFPVMYPVIYRAGLSLHEDDVAAVSALYPGPSLNSAYGELSGTLTQASGTPILGANIWAREINTDKVYSVVSDYLMQGTGYFRLLLPAGTYDLHAEAIAKTLTGASRVGPYAGSLADSSFQPPLYDANGAAMAPVTLGGGTPIKFVIAAGCNSASTVFKIDGTGSLSSSCQLPPDNQSPTVPSGLSATAITSSQINLAWTASTDNVGVTAYKVLRGGVAIATLGNVTNYSDTGLTASTTYSYTVQACDGAGNCSAQSAAAAATTAPLPLNGACGAANGVPIATAPSAGLCNSGAASAVTGSSTQWAWTCSGSAGGTTAACSAPRIDTQAPTVPTGLSATAINSSQINLAWTASTDNVGVTAYKVYRDGFPIAVLGNVASYSNSGLMAGTTYSYTVQACDAAGNCSAQSAAAAAATAPTFTSQSDCFFNWAAGSYPNFFAPANAASGTSGPIYFRYYAQTQAYLATYAVDNHVYYLGPVTNHTVFDLGPLAGWLSFAGCQ